MVIITAQSAVAETGAEHYYFSLLVPEATCLLDTGGLRLHCVATSYVFSAQVH